MRQAGLRGVVLKRVARRGTPQVMNR
jgi:hypothetical protein